MLKNDKWIIDQCNHGMITPFRSELVRHNEYNHSILSYGCSSYGYDIRLSSKEFFLFSPQDSDQKYRYSSIDPKEFEKSHLINARLHQSPNGEFFYVPPFTYALGVSVEHFNMPSNTTAICIGKSTYARCGISINVTPLEAGWSGYLTIELFNHAPKPCKIYVNEGIAQLLFFEGDPCNTNYLERSGKYQNQPYQVVFASC